MKRKLFFFIDKLEVQRSERIAVSVLFVSLLVLSSYNSMLKPDANFDADYYAELEQVFEARSQVVQMEEEQILARYESESDGVQVAALQPETVTPDTVESDSTREQPVTGGERININEAGEEELQELPGIGPAFAERIIEWREENGEFTSKEQLIEVRGIGERRLEVIKPLIKL